MFTADEVLHFCKPCVYAWKRGEQYLYIGASTYGLKRLLTHSRINKDEHLIRPTDTFEFWHVPLNDLFEREDAMIQELRPLLNRTIKHTRKRCKQCAQEFDTYKRNMVYCSPVCRYRVKRLELDHMKAFRRTYMKQYIERNRHDPSPPLDRTL